MACRVLCFDAVTLSCKINCVTKFICYFLYYFFSIDASFVQMNALKQFKPQYSSHLGHSNVSVKFFPRKTTVHLLYSFTVLFHVIQF